ncbi:MAG: hypothetical protein GVY28_08220, partial [Alphaproteobacteria bacterium]|nr:hypothetical protein [Alphaproteobacteria bacterium]
GLIAGSVGLQLAAVLFPPLRGLLGQSALGAADYGIVAASGGAAYLINEAWKEWAPPPAEPGRSEETAQ